MVENVWLTLLAPLVGFAWCALFGRLWPRLAGWIASLAVGIAFVAALSVLSGLLVLAPDDRVRIGDLYPWIVSAAGPGAFSVPIRIMVDPLSTAMLVIVTGVSFLIHVYSTGYMHADPGYGRFFAYMNLFVFSMVLLVLAGNFLLLMVGWGGVGLCSYLLIAFWFEVPANAAAGVKAFVVNAIGDVGLILANALILTTFKTVDYVTVFKSAKATLPAGGEVVTAITLLLLLAAVAKSAQLPLYVWLPDAMAGPTPVSALIHAATMVTAGVYLIARASPLFTLAPFTMELVAWIGAITALFAATIGLVKLNIKRVLAYSTVSQLGYMFLAVGVGGFTAGIFHLMTHAFFKALLFLGAGAVIHYLHGEEEMPRMGGLARRLPLVYGTFLIAALAISGFPLLSGFFSKDEIISLAFTSPLGSPALGVIGLVTALLTAIYMFRLVFMTFHGKTRVEPAVLEHAHEPGSNMTIPLVVLAVLAALGGYLEWPPGDRFARFLEPAFTYFGVTPQIETGLNVPVSAVAAALAIVGILIAYLIWYRSPQTAVSLGRTFAPIRTALLYDYGIDELYRVTVVAAARGLGRVAADVVDPKVIDGAVNGLPVLVGWVSSAFARLESGFVRRYAMAILAGAFVIILYMLRRAFGG